MKVVQLKPGLGLAVMLGWAMLPGCSSVVSQPAPSVSTAALAFTVWTVPDTAMRARIQVRLAPHQAIAKARLSIGAPPPGLDISPTEFTLTQLAPPKFTAPGHNPPELGRTLVRTFLVSARHAGHFQVKVTLLYDNHSDTRTVELDFPINGSH